MNIDIHFPNTRT